MTETEDKQLLQAARWHASQPVPKGGCGLPHFFWRIVENELERELGPDYREQLNRNGVPTHPV